MNIYAWVLLGAFAAAALADWAAVARRRPDLESVAKPAVLVILILLAWLLRADSVDYGNQLLLGLVLSLIGDVLLLGRSDRHFLAGLIAFLLAHVAYIAAFRRIPGEAPIWWGVIAIAVLGGRGDPHQGAADRPGERPGRHTPCGLCAGGGRDGRPRVGDRAARRRDRGHAVPRE